MSTQRTLKAKLPSYGPHPSVADGYLTAVEAVKDIGASALQIWTGNNQSYNARLISKETYKPVAKFVKEHELFMVAHSPYILNFAHPDPSTARERYLKDLVNITNLGGLGSVLHMGANVKTLKQSITTAYQNFVKNLRWIVERMPDSAVIILENMAGGGTRMACKMEEWADFWNNYVDDDLKKRIRWCVDTAHLYATGEYDLSKRTEALRFYRDFDRHIGWEYLLCFHFNGSKTKLGSKNDNHADIGWQTSGEIETKGLRQIARIAGATNKPLILEVPTDETPMEEQFEIIKSWF